MADLEPASNIEYEQIPYIPQDVLDQELIPSEEFSTETTKLWAECLTKLGVHFRSGEVLDPIPMHNAFKQLPPETRIFNGGELGKLSENWTFDLKHALGFVNAGNEGIRKRPVLKIMRIGDLLQKQTKRSQCISFLMFIVIL